MRTARRSIWLCAGLWLGGCAGSAREPPARVADEPPTTSLDWAIADAVAQEQEQEARSRRMTGADPRADRWQVRRVGEPERALPPLGRRHRVDVRFAGAELGEALRFLADAGGFALVTDGELGARVTADLRRVRPYEALVALAEAHGASVERRGKIVIVTRGAR